MLTGQSENIKIHGIRNTRVSLPTGGPYGEMEKIDSPDNYRRKRRIQIRPSALVNILTNRNVMQVISGLPDGSDWISFCFIGGEGFILEVAHPSFSEIPEGCPTPFHAVAALHMDGEALDIALRILEHSGGEVERI